jgi:predicted NBD/HSP70 family sugar kinase
MFSEYSLIQKQRMNAILKSILKNKRITRNQLANTLKLSISSIAKYIKTLIGVGLVRETEREVSKGGRRSTFIELNPEIGINIAIVLNVSCIKGVLINVVGETVAEYETEVYFGISREQLLTSLFKVLDNLMIEAKKFNKKIFGIGIGLGGYMDPVQGVSHEYLYAKNWYDVPLKQLVEEKYRIPCFLVNDANACALGEKYYGMGVGVDHFLCVLLGEGVGMGIVVNGEIYMGKGYYAGEFGHTHSVQNGQLCFCGHTGCLETVSSMQYILSVGMEGLSQGVNSEVLKYCENDIAGLKIEHMIIAANNGDRFARNVFEQAGRFLGEKLADIANIFNPELIILRGPVIDGNRFLFETIERIVMNLSLRPVAKSMKILYSEERSDIRFMGINSLILIDYFSQ